VVAAAGDRTGQGSRCLITRQSPADGPAIAAGPSALFVAGPSTFFVPIPVASIKAPEDHAAYMS
jgi:hypothetical protein